MITLSARIAIGFGAFLAVAEIVRNWGDWEPWPWWVVDYIAVALLLYGGRAGAAGPRAAHRRSARRRVGLHVRDVLREFLQPSRVAEREGHRADRVAYADRRDRRALRDHDPRARARDRRIAARGAARDPRSRRARRSRGTGRRASSAPSRRRRRSSRRCPATSATSCGAASKRESRYLLLVWWATLEDHTVGFRGSPGVPALEGAAAPVLRAVPDRRALRAALRRRAPEFDDARTRSPHAAPAAPAHALRDLPDIERMQADAQDDGDARRRARRRAVTRRMRRGHGSRTGTSTASDSGSRATRRPTRSPGAAGSSTPSSAADAEVEVGVRLPAGVLGTRPRHRAGAASVRAGFEELGLADLVCFTLTTNRASQRVMEKVGFGFEREVEHAGLPHLLYRLRAAAWRDAVRSRRALAAAALRRAACARASARLRAAAGAKLVDAGAARERRRRLRTASSRAPTSAARSRRSPTRARRPT